MNCKELSACDKRVFFATFAPAWGRSSEIWGQVFFILYLPNSDIIATSLCLIFTMSLLAVKNCRPDTVMTVIVGVVGPRRGSCPRILHVSSHLLKERSGFEPGACPGSLTLL